jgi:putative lipoic acid-binding regulatory protein
MESCPRPVEDYPQRVPIKVIGREAEMDPAPMHALIRAHLGEQPEPDRTHGVNAKGAFTSFTFWVTLPHAAAEAPLREALQKLPGVVMQL